MNNDTFKPELFALTTDGLRAAVREEMIKVLHDCLPAAIKQATEKPYLTKTEVLDLLGCSPRKLAYLRDSRQIPYIKIGRTILYPRRDVMVWLEKHRVD